MNFLNRVINKKIGEAPNEPGVYIFFRKKHALYIGKAGSLKNRLRSYFQGKNFKNELLQKNADKLKIIPLRSEIEALLQEAKLIKKLNPTYNVLWRDDANYFYVAITKEKFPRIFLTHRPEKKEGETESDFIGPFTDGKALKLCLRLLRRSFPYCTCKNSHLRVCLNAQIGNCPGFCCQKSQHPTKKEINSYRKNINTTKSFLLGKELEKFPKNLSLEGKMAVEKILAHREFLENFDIAESGGINLTTNYSIEGYDISHLAGREPIGVMTHWDFNGETLIPQKDFWRKFIIRIAKAADDPGALKEVLNRRLNHAEWPFPSLIIIDGGIAQFKTAQKELGPLLKKIRLISFAKPNGLVYGLGTKPKPLRQASLEIQKIIPRLIQETHNFAIRSHRHRRQKEFLTNNMLK